MFHLALLMVLFSWCLVVLVQAERLGQDAGCDLLGLIQSRKASDVRELARKKPKLYVYDLPSHFQNGGRLEKKYGPAENWTMEQVFRGPPQDADGFPVWGSENHDMAVQVHYRFLSSPQRTLDVDEADVFLIPAYEMHVKTDKYCAKRSDLVDTLVSLNPKLKDKHWVKEKGPRHLLVNARVEVCDYMLDLEQPLRSAVRTGVGPEINGTLENGFFWTHGQPWDWYLLPFPSMFHGPVTPAEHRPRGIARWLWTFFGQADHGRAQPLRKQLIEHCKKDSKCNSRDETELLFYKHSVATVAKHKLHSTFCAEPPGYTINRKSILDSIIAGCIPILFAHHELDLYGLLVTPEEWALATLFIPEAKLVAKPDWSHFATDPFFNGTTGEQLKKLHPEHASLFDALHPKNSEDQRNASVEALFPKLSSISSLLQAISEEEVKKKQKALAKIAHRFVIGVDDSRDDAVNILLRHISTRTPS